MSASATSGQLARTLDSPGGAVVVLSASREVEHGARGMILVLPGVFRLDARPTGDTLQTIVRGFERRRLEFEGHGQRGPAFAYAEQTDQLAGLGPARFDIRFALRGERDTVRVETIVGALRFPERGVTRLTAQATVRRRDGDG